MRCKAIVGSLLAICLFSSVGFTQPNYVVKVTITDSTPRFGATSQIGTYEIAMADTSKCSIGMVLSGDSHRGFVSLEPRYVVDNSYVELPTNGTIVYHGGFIGRLTFRLPVIVNGNCGLEYDTAKFTISAISDSGISILPYGWTLSMVSDSSHRYYTATCTSTFDNNVFDSTLFYGFTAIPYSGGIVKLQVFDSLTPITSYLAPPYARKKPLTLVFSSVFFHAFDSVLFSTRLRNHSLDSVISYFLPVTWAAPASVAQVPSHGESFALPNPFTSHATIGFTLTKPELVKLQLFDFGGRAIRMTERKGAVGTNEIEVDTRDVLPGCYWYIVQGGEWQRSGALVKVVE